MQQIETRYLIRETLYNRLKGETEIGQNQFASMRSEIGDLSVRS